MFSIREKVILVTGGGGALCGQIAAALADYGALVYVLDLAFPKQKEEISKNLFQIECDVTDGNKFRTFCEDIFSKHGRIDVLVNGAGVVYTKKDSELYPKEEWDKALAVNLTAPFVCSQIAFEYMVKNKKGSIINITSLAAERGFPNNPAYCASKGGLRVLTKSFARDWGESGIRVNNIVPGYMGAGMTGETYKDESIRKFRAALTMLGRWGSPEDLIGPVIFLASDASSYITGADIHVDGGWLANGLPKQVT